MSIKTALFGLLQPSNFVHNGNKVAANAIAYSFESDERGKQLRIHIKALEGEILTVDWEHVNVERLIT